MMYFVCESCVTWLGPSKKTKNGYDGKTGSEVLKFSTQAAETQIHGRLGHTVEGRLLGDPPNAATYGTIVDLFLCHNMRG
jgi:hypothetical protein